MIEIVKALVDLIAKAVPALTGAQRTKKLNTIGAELFLIYFRLNEVLVTAERIIRSMEAYVERMSRHMADGSDPYALTAGDWIREELEKQSINLTRVRNLLDLHNVRLVLLDGDTFLRLAPLIDWKNGAIGALLGAISDGKLPASPSADDLGFLLATDHVWRRNDRYDEIMQHVCDDGIPVDRPWDRDTYRIVTAYLRERDPRTQLTEIRQAVAQLRTALLDHFSIEDMLLAVGDERFAT